MQIEQLSGNPKMSLKSRSSHFRYSSIHRVRSEKYRGHLQQPKVQDSKAPEAFQEVHQNTLEGSETSSNNETDSDEPPGVN